MGAVDAQLSRNRSIPIAPDIVLSTQRLFVHVIFIRTFDRAADQ